MSCDISHIRSRHTHPTQATTWTLPQLPCLTPTHTRHSAASQAECVYFTIMSIMSLCKRYGGCARLPQGPCAFPSARIHMLFYMHSSFSVAHSICRCEGLYLSRCAHLQLVHISMRTGVHTAHCQGCMRLCARIGGAHLDWGYSLSQFYLHVCTCH